MQGRESTYFLGHVCGWLEVTKRKSEEGEAASYSLLEIG